jgi:hypothetical protein
MSSNSTAITSSSYASSVHKHMAAVNTLLATDDTLAFNLLLSMADASHTDLDATCKMCGAPTTAAFQLLSCWMRHFTTDTNAGETHQPKSRAARSTDVVDAQGCGRGCVQDWKAKQITMESNVPPEAGMGEE